MGGSLKTKKNKSPTFLVWAMADAQGTNLQRVQIIKDGSIMENLKRRSMTQPVVMDWK